MSHGIKIRIAAFLVLSAVGIVYIAASYLGFVDKLLGRGYTVHATLPSSGGLFEGSEVTYRGVQIGRVAEMNVIDEGVRLDLEMEDDAKVPLGSPIYVHNLSAVGEQYLDFEPPSDDGPYAEDGDTFTGGPKSMPVPEEELLLQLDAFVGSVDKQNLGTVISELGLLFRDTGRPLQRLLDGGTEFIDEAAAHREETVRLLDNGLSVLRTQQGEGENIRAFARDLALITDTLRGSDKDLRTVLQGTPGAVREVQRLLEDLEPTMPVMLADLVTVNQMVVSHLPGIEQLLVSFPRAIAAGFTGTPGDGWGHVNLQFAQDPGPCTGPGYKPPDQWRRGDELSDGPIFPARCLAGAPFNQRGSKYAPGPTGPATTRSAYRGTYDPVTGASNAAYGPNGDPVRVHAPANLSVLGNDSWKWLLMGPVGEQ